MPQQCSENKLFSMENEFSHTSVNAPKVRVRLYALTTVGIAWSAQLNVLRMLAIVHFPSSGGTGVSVIFFTRYSQAKVYSDSTTSAQTNSSRGVTFDGSRKLSSASGFKAASALISSLLRSPKHASIPPCTSLITL